MGLAIYPVTKTLVEVAIDRWGGMRPEMMTIDNAVYSTTIDLLRQSLMERAIPKTDKSKTYSSVRIKIQ